MFLPNLLSLIVSGVVGVVMAAMGAGVWSLVGQRLAETGVSSVLFFAASAWKPRFLWSGPAARELFKYGVGLTGFNLVNYWARSADSLLIGKFMGSQVLGLYSRAYSLMLLPLSQVISVIAPVMFPALSSIQGDKPRVKRAYLRVMNLLTFITFPMMLGLILVADPFVRVLFGPEWTGVIPLIQILGAVGMLQTLCNPTGWIYTSQGRTDWMFYWGLGGSGLLIVSIIIGIAFGSAQSVAVAYLIGNVIITGPCIAIPGRLIDMKLNDVWHAIRGNLTCAVIMGTIVWGTGWLLPVGAAPWVKLGLQVVAGALAYGALAWRARLAAIVELQELSARFLAQRRTRRLEHQISKQTDSNQATV